MIIVPFGYLPLDDWFKAATPEAQIWICNALLGEPQEYNFSAFSRELQEEICIGMSHAARMSLENMRDLRLASQVSKKLAKQGGLMAQQWRDLLWEMWASLCLVGLGFLVFYCIVLMAAFWPGELEKMRRM